MTARVIRVDWAAWRATDAKMRRILGTNVFHAEVAETPTMAPAPVQEAAPALAVTEPALPGMAAWLAPQRRR